MKLVVWKMDIVGHLITVCHFFVGFGGGGGGVFVLVEILKFWKGSTKIKNF